jgi:hypothetical protein
MRQMLFDDSPAEHFTDELRFRTILPRMAKLIDSQLARRSLTSDNCVFEYAHTGRLSNSVGQTCLFQASFRLKDNPESCALFEVVETLHPNGTGRDLKGSLRYERVVA